MSKSKKRNHKSIPELGQMIIEALPQKTILLNYGKFIVVHTPTGKYEIGNSDVDLLRKWKKRNDGRLYLGRVGFKSAYEMSTPDIAKWL